LKGHGGTILFDADSSQTLKYSYGSKPKIQSSILFTPGVICERVSNVTIVPNFENRQIQDWNSLISQKDAKDGPSLYVIGIPRIEAVFRVLYWDRDVTLQSRLKPEHRAIQKHMIAMLHVLINKRPSEDLLQMLGLLDDKPFGDVKIMGIVDDGPSLVRSGPAYRALYAFLVDYELHAGASIWNHRLSINCKLFETANGYLGMGPESIDPDDLVCVVFRCRLPVVLRHVETHFILVGICFTLGLMDGEAVAIVASGLREVQEFEIH
jgi:hypothetical protein